MGNGLIWFGVPVAVLVALILWAVGIYNRLVRERNVVREAWSGIDVQLKRRHDLVPNLVNTVKGYQTHEQSVLEHVVELRNRAQSAQGVAETGKAESALAAGLRQLFALAEAYPDLKADANFRQLSENLAAIEEQVQLARRYYNGAVRDYNTSIEVFPNVLLAAPLGFTKSAFFELEAPEERQVPQVQF